MLAVIILIFCAGYKDVCAAKLRLFWQKLPKLTVIVFISDLFWLVGVLSPNPVAFGEKLDSKLLLVLYLSIIRIFFVKPPPSLETIGGYFFLGCFL